jgi:hypothetical protein
VLPTRTKNYRERKSRLTNSANTHNSTNPNILPLLFIILNKITAVRRRGIGRNSRYKETAFWIVFVEAPRTMCGTHIPYEAEFKFRKKLFPSLKTSFCPKRYGSLYDWSLEREICEPVLKRYFTNPWQKWIPSQNLNSGEPPYHGPNIYKTPNTKCRLYWCLIEFIDWRYSQSCWYFRPLLWTGAPLTFLLVHHLYPPLPPFLCK